MELRFIEQYETETGKTAIVKHDHVINKIMIGADYVEFVETWLQEMLECYEKSMGIKQDE